MVMTAGIENHIRKNETFKIPSAIQTGRSKGMFLLDDHLMDIFQRGLIDEGELLSKCQDTRQVREKLGL
jgi:twitching motility protein PilT